MMSWLDVRLAYARQATVGFLYFSLVGICEINRIHHWCSIGTEKSQPEGPPFQWETRLAEFSTERWPRGLGFFLEPLNTNDRFFFSYTTTVRYSTVWYLLVTSLRSMFTVNDARCTNQLETANKQCIKQ